MPGPAADSPLWQPRSWDTELGLLHEPSPPSLSRWSCRRRVPKCTSSPLSCYPGITPHTHPLPRASVSPCVSEEDRDRGAQDPAFSRAPSGANTCLLGEVERGDAAPITPRLSQSQSHVLTRSRSVCSVPLSRALHPFISSSPCIYVDPSPFQFPRLGPRPSFPA